MTIILLGDLPRFLTCELGNCVIEPPRHIGTLKSGQILRAVPRRWGDRIQLATHIKSRRRQPAYPVGSQSPTAHDSGCHTQIYPANLPPPRTPVAATTIDLPLPWFISRNQAISRAEWCLVRRAFLKFSLIIITKYYSPFRTAKLAKEIKL